MTSENWGPALRQLHTVLNAGALGTLADATLLERFLSGRGNADTSAAFAALVERHGPMVMTVCRDVLRDLHDAEDASQATFLVLAKKAGSIRRGDSLASWLFGVALRVAAKARAEAARRRAIERRGSDVNARSSAEGMRGIPCPELYEELNRLPERFRAPIVLCHLEGLTNEQAAGQLGLPVRTVQRRLAQGRERLRAGLVGRGVQPTDGLMGRGFAALAPSEPWLEATVRAASGLAAAREMTTVASAAVAALTQGVLSMTFAGRLKIVAAAVMAAGAVIVILVGAHGAIASRRQAEPSRRKAEAGQAGSQHDGRKDESPSVVGVGPRIRGLVLDTSGRPVGGARISLLRSRAPQSVTSKPDGTFVVAADDPRLLNVSLVAISDGGARQGIFRFNDPTTGPHDPRTLARIVLKPLRAVTVSVVDGRGAPVEGAFVVLLDVGFPIAEGRSNAQGIVTLSAPVDAMAHWIFGFKPGVGFDYFENYPNSPSGRSPLPVRAGLVFDGTRTVRIRAMDSDNRPVPGIEIAPSGVYKNGKRSAINLSDSPARARTDAQGIATFDWLPGENTQRWMDFVVATPSYSLLKSPLLVPNASDVELTARILRVTPISGTITRPDGTPAAGILVIAESFTQPFRSGRARTAADGSYKIDLPSEQPYTVYVADDEWAARSKSVFVRDGESRPGVDLILERGIAIRGRVTAGEPPQPAPGLAVTLVAEMPDVLPGGGTAHRHAPVRIADTDHDGRYTFRVGPGVYYLFGPNPPDSAAASELFMVRDGEDIERDFRLPRLSVPGRTVRGVVRSNRLDGPPIGRAIVVSGPIESGSALSQAFADGNGRFELPRPFRTALVYARDSSGSLAGSSVAGDDRESEMTIVARPAATARGRVVDASAKPWVNVRVYYALSPKLEDADRPGNLGLSVLTDDLGRFTLSGLFVGARGMLYAIHPAGGHSPRKSFEVKDAQPIDLGDVVLRPR